MNQAAHTSAGISEKGHIVRLENLTKVYRQGKIEVRAVDGVTLDIHSGDFAALCGPSGSGKTSLLNLIGGLDVPTSGRVWVDGADLASLDRTALSEVRKNRIGFVFQAYNLIPVMTAFENAEFVLNLQSVGEDECRDRVMATLKAFPSRRVLNWRSLLTAFWLVGSAPSP